jgi:hypothetical protein
MLLRRVIFLPLMCGLAAVVDWAAASVAATPASPGACHMMNANPIGIAGIRGAADQGVSASRLLAVADRLGAEVRARERARQQLKR